MKNWCTILETLKILGMGAFDTKIQIIHVFFLIVLLETENVNSKYWNKWGRVLPTEWNSNINEDN